MGKSRNTTCFIPGCKTGYRGQCCEEKISTFKVPRDVLEIEKWAKNISRYDRVLQERDCVCEKHFYPEDVIKFIEVNNVKIPYQRPRLRKGAVPAIFDDCTKYTTKRKVTPQKPLRTQCPKISLNEICETQLEDDVENYWQYKLMKNVHPKLKKGVIPHIFTCQKDFLAERETAVKKDRKRLVQEVRHQMSVYETEGPVPSTSKGYPTVAEEMEFRETKGIQRNMKTEEFADDFHTEIETESGVHMVKIEQQEEDIVDTNTESSSSVVDEKLAINHEPLRLEDEPRGAFHVDDEFEIVGKNVATKLRQLPVTQRIFAERLINEVLFEAQLGTLNRACKLVIGKMDVQQLDTMEDIKPFL